MGTHKVRHSKCHPRHFFTSVIQRRNGKAVSEYNSDAMDTIISDETDEERTCLLGGGAGRSPIDRVIGGLRERQGLFYLLTLESIGFVSTEDENFYLYIRRFSSSVKALKRAIQ